MCPSLIEIGSKKAEKNSKLCTNKQTDKQTDRHYENNGHLAVNQLNVDFSTHSIDFCNVAALAISSTGGSLCLLKNESETE